MKQGSLLVLAFVFCLLAAVCSAAEVTDSDLASSRTLIACGEKPPPDKVSSVQERHYSSPYQGNVPFSGYIQPGDGIVQWYKERVYLIPGYGICSSKTGQRLEINYVEDRLAYPGFCSAAYPGYCEYFRDANNTLLKGGDCEDRAIAMGSLLRAMGYPAMVVRGYRYVNGQPECHYLVEYAVSGKVYCGDFDYDSERSSGSYYCHTFSGENKCFAKDAMFNEYQNIVPYDRDWWIL